MFYSKVKSPKWRSFTLTDHKEPIYTLYVYVSTGNAYACIDTSVHMHRRTRIQVYLHEGNLYGYMSMQTPGVTTIVTIKSKVPNSPETVPIYRYIHDDMSTQIPHASIDTPEHVYQR